MNPIRKLLLPFLCLAFGLGARAQGEITTSVLEVSTPSVYYNDVIHIRLSYTYLSPQPYQGNLLFAYTTTTTSLVQEALNPAQAVSLQNGDGDTVDVLLPVIPAMFSTGGGHTVIVWPILSPGPVDFRIDSSRFDIEVLGWLGQPENTGMKQARIFPVPAQDHLLLEMPENVPSATLVLFDAKGTRLGTWQATQKQTRIPLDGLPPGPYFIRYADDRHAPEVHRFMKQ